jgi:O-antigen ligase
VLSRRLHIPAMVLAAGGVFGIILTGSRGALLSWILFVVLLAGLSRARLRAAVSGVLVLVPCALAVWYLDHSGILASPNIFGRIASETMGTESLDASRLKIWLSSLQQITVHPLFGSGPEGYWLSGCCDRRIMQAHNFVLQFLMEFGVVGCGILMLLVLQAVKGLGGIAGTIGAALATPANRVLTCLLASFLAYSLIDQMMYHLVPLVHLGVFAGLYAAGLARAHADKKPS